ncbi:MAG TPA: 16S rRNA (cytosine(1402)-N(4))-methyltransferase RsmH [Dehalococcoidia bacterium]|jgi:16S rRNA (cytosine1402-N4)-methyltransferase|nr:16S rRNA (cytosine(1402)-N(4))-methyltransferase RsmH [Dehalococcoidia bacterium]
MPSSGHVPVLLEETMRALAVQPGGRYIDCTLGGGGHALAILERSAPGGQLLGIDADPEAIAVARERLAPYADCVRLINDNFASLQAICLKYDFFPVHGILFDLGLSSLQLESARGFSFQHDAPLDMRFDPAQEVTAADIVNTWAEAELARLIRAYGEESCSQRIAREIVRERPIRSTLHLARVVERAVGRRRGRIHPATKTFQALRITVNRELENLELALKQAVELLGFEGRLVVISYHSLEDRIVKQFMQREARDCICPPNTPTCVCGHKAQLRLISRRVITPSAAEIERNPRSRSARLRAAERTMVQDDCYEIPELENLLTEVKAKAWRRPALLKKLQMVFTMA